MKLSCWTTTAWNSHNQSRRPDRLVQTHHSGCCLKTFYLSLWLCCHVHIAPERISDIRFSPLCLTHDVMFSKSQNRASQSCTCTYTVWKPSYLQSAEQEMQIGDTVEDLLLERRNHWLSCQLKTSCPVRVLSFSVAWRQQSIWCALAYCCACLCLLKCTMDGGSASI